MDENIKKYLIEEKKQRFLKWKIGSCGWGFGTREGKQLDSHKYTHIHSTIFKLLLGK